MDFATKIGLFLALLALGVTVAALFAPYEWRDMPRWVRRGGLGVGLLLIPASIVCLFALPDEQKPEVSLRFVTVQYAYIQLVNTSDVVASNIKWMVAAFNLSSLQQKRDPLPVPASNFDVLTAKNASLPINVFQTPLVSPLVKSGDRIFGSASVTCPTCSRGRTYWFYVVYGQRGWYAENPDVTNGNIVFPKDVNHIEEFADHLVGTIPSAARISIKDLP
jgi:hypothetical protein